VTGGSTPVTGKDQQAAAKHTSDGELYLPVTRNFT
jgi:hypothetical protein